MSNTQAQLEYLRKAVRHVVEVEAYHRIRHSFLRPAGKSWLFGALLCSAALGSFFFMIAIAYDPPEPEDSAGPVLGFLMAGSDPVASQALWDDLDLDACEIASEVPVLVLSNRQDQHRVQTMPIQDCDVWSST